MEDTEENQAPETPEQEEVVKRLIPASELKTIRPARHAIIKCCSGKR
jgi:hypothetical protein